MMVFGTGGIVSAYAEDPVDVSSKCGRVRDGSRDSAFDTHDSKGISLDVLSSKSTCCGLQTPRHSPSTDSTRSSTPCSYNDTTYDDLKKSLDSPREISDSDSATREVSPMPVTREASPAPLWKGISPTEWIEDVYTRHGQVQKPTPHLLIAGYIFKHV